MRRTAPILAAAGLMLAACATSPTAPPPAAPGTEVAARSAESIELEAYYARVQAGLLAKGLLRTDGGGPDTPYTERDLERNFLQVALFEEYRQVDGQLVQVETQSRLRRWRGPVRIEVEFGPGVSAADAAGDRRTIEDYAARLSRATGHPIGTVTADGNYHVIILHADDRRTIGPRLRELLPNITPGEVRAVENLPRSSFCLVLALDPRNDGIYTKAVAIIPAEHPDLLRRSCIHEEIAQGLGLANDSPAARPSIFNDDEEFALLTTQDEQMLQMLYDPRLRPGMTLAEARPVVRIMATEIAGPRPDV